MKRSAINAIIKDMIQYLTSRYFYLPEWAYWKVSEWEQNKSKCRAIFDAKLGWDVSDCGIDFSTHGLVLFTIRNGKIGDMSRPYCEKIIVMDKGQTVPYHYHKEKTEDIINRSDSELGFRLGNATSDGMSDEGIIVSIDGIETEVMAGKELILKPGQSILLYPRVYHSFYPVSTRTLIGEVSKVNDDVNDNFFLENMSRFPVIEEDVPILYPLITDYERL